MISGTVCKFGFRVLNVAKLYMGGQNCNIITIRNLIIITDDNINLIHKKNCDNNRKAAVNLWTVWDGGF